LALALLPARVARDIRKELHRLANQLVDEPDIPQLHANIDAQAEDDLPDALVRMHLFLELSASQIGSAQRDDGGSEDFRAR
jgi:hypothetical protein